MDVKRLHEANVAGLWGNSNYDGDGKGAAPRRGALEELDENAARAIRQIYGEKPESEEIDHDNPFFAAMKLPKMDDGVESTREAMGKFPEPAEIDQA